MGILCGHEGTVSRIVIQNEHMISSADDGTIRLNYFESFKLFVNIELGYGPPRTGKKLSS